MSRPAARLGSSIIVTIVLLAGSAMLGLAQARTVHGTIIQIIAGPPAQLVVRTDTTSVTVTLADSSLIQRRGKSGAAVAIPVAQLKVGDEVIISVNEINEVLSVLVLTSQPSAAAGQTQPPAAVVQVTPVEQPTWTSGDTWTWRFLPLGKNVTFTTSGCDQMSGCGLMLTGSAQVMLAVPGIINFAPDTKGNTYFSVFEWPLVLGMTWTHVGKATGWTSVQVGGGNPTPSDSWRTMFTVAAFEHVRVLAGTFDAVRIDGRQCNEAQQNVCRDFAIWYASRAKYFIKIEYGGSNDWPSPPRGGRWEILSYQVH